MAKRRTSRRSRRTRKSSRKQAGGGWGFTGASSIPGTPGTVSNPQVFTGIGDCRATEPGYWIPQSNYGTYQKGLPGMSGGRRKTMKGGRYTFDLSPPSVNGVAPNAAAWWAGTYPPVQRIACEGSTPNPLNPGPHTPSTQPLPVASANLGLNPQSGGGVSPGTVGVGNVDSMYYYAPTAGYDNRPSNWVDSVGAPVQLQVPFAARELNPSCITTGHPPPLTGALQKGGRRYRKRGGGLLNTLRNGLKTVTNTVGLTRRNNSLNANVGSVYNAVGSLNTPNAAPLRIRIPPNRSNNFGIPPLPASPATTNTTLPPLPPRNNLSNLPIEENEENEYNYNFNNVNNYSSQNSYGTLPNYFSDGGKRKRRGSKKSRKARKGRKH